MGLTVNDIITLKNGMKVNGAYISFSGQSIGLIPGPSARLMAPVTGQTIPDVVNLKKNGRLHRKWILQYLAKQGCKRRRLSPD
jgi:hypothetical protein